MTKPWDDPHIVAGMKAQLAQRRMRIAAGGQPLGWKVGFGAPAAMKTLGITAPLVGYLMRSALVPTGGEVSLAGWVKPVAEPEIAVHMGKDLCGADLETVRAAIAGLGPAIELADLDQAPSDVEAILAGNIFHRAVTFGPRVETQTPGAARILVNGEEQHALSADHAGANLTAMIDVVAGRLEDAGERLQPGDRIITGVLAPPHKAQPGDTVRLELEALGGVELRFS